MSDTRSRVGRRTPGCCFLLLSIVGVSLVAGSPGLDAATPSVPALSAELTTLAGPPLQLERLLRDGPVVLAFWATWCEPCKVEIVKLDQLHRRLAPSAAVVAVNVDPVSELGEVRSFVASRGLQCPVVLDPEAILATRFQPELTLPFTVVLGPDGASRLRHTGYLAGDELLVEQAVRVAMSVSSTISDTSDTDALPRPTWELFATLLGEWDRQGAARRSLLSRTGAGMSWWLLSARIRYDFLLVQPEAQEGTLTQGTLGLLYLQAQGRRWLLRGGDIYPVLAHGLLLHLTPTPALGEETSLRGALAAGQVGPLRASLFGGLTQTSHTAELLEGTISTTRNPTFGGSLTAQTAGLEVSVAGLRTESEDLRKPFAQRTKAEGMQGLGAELTARLVATELVAAGAWLTDLAGEQPGKGLYVSASRPFGRLHVALEGKWYQQLDLIYGGDRITYNRPPTLEPEEQLFTRAPDAVDTAGTRLRLAWNDAAWPLGLQAGLGVFRGHEGYQAMHAAGGISWNTPNILLELTGGLRVERWRWQQLEPLSGHWLFGKARVSLPLPARQTIEWSGSVQQAVRERDELSLLDGESRLGYSLAPWFQAFIRFEHKESPHEEMEREDFLSAGLGVRPWEPLLLTLLVGELPGGPFCSAGICRTLPAFSGVRVETSFSY